MEILKFIFEFIMDILETVVFIGSIFMVVYLFVFQPNQVRGSSMEPSFYNGEYFFTSKIAYKFKEFERGDVIVLKDPKNEEIDFIKRIIGLPGDTLLFKDGEVYVNGTKLNEPYIPAKTPVWDHGAVAENVPFVVPQADVFVMGDNRERSSDSREFGPIPIESVIGMVFYRYYPTARMGVISNPFPLSLRKKEHISVLPSFNHLFHNFG